MEVTPMQPVAAVAVHSLRQTLRVHGIKLRVLKSNWAIHNWTGRSTTLTVSGSHGIADIFHEAAHALVAPAERRTLPEWGIGSSPNALGTAQLHTSHTESIRDEARASMLGILWLRQFDSARANDTFLEHGWDWGDLRTARSTVKWLRKRGLLTRAQGRLTVPTNRSNDGKSNI